MPTTARAVRVAHFDLPPLPYPYEALEPVISRETLQLHHDKHHKKYVDTMNQLLEKENVHAASLEEVVKHSSGKLFNNSGQRSEERRVGKECRYRDGRSHE